MSLLTETRTELARRGVAETVALSLVASEASLFLEQLDHPMGVPDADALRAAHAAADFSTKRRRAASDAFHVAVEQAFLAGEL